jgi:PKD repeat protein
VIYQGYGSDGFAGLPAPGFLYNLSARWFGQIEVRAEDPQVPAAQNVRFRVSSDGGARFYVYGLNGVSQWTTAINDGGSHDYAPAYSSTYSMAPGTYWIQLDYSNTSGFSGIALEYETSTDAWRSVSVAYDGGDGRLILAGNTGISPTSLSSAPSTLGGQPASVVGARTDLLRGPRLDNPYVTDLSGASAALDDSPYIAGLAGGAEIYGLLQGIDKSGLDFNPATTQKEGLPTTEGDAVFAVMRLDIGPGDYADDYTGFDMLLFVNLADDVALSDPRLIVSQAGNPVGTQALAIDGVGAFQNLTALGAKQVWATLIPDSENLKFDASVHINGQTVMLDNQALARNQVVYGKFAPSLLAEASLNGLAAIARSPDGKQIYAVDPSRNALGEPLSWDIDGDGRFGEVSGSSFTLSWQQLVDFGLADDGQYQIAVKATNGSGFESVGLATLIIDNTPPQILLNGAGSTLAGEVYTLDFSASDPGDDRVSAWRVDWNDGSPVEDLGSNAQHATHAFGEPGSYSVLLTGSDEDTAVSVNKTVSVGVSSTQVSVGGPYTIMKGDALTLRASAVGTPIEVQWDINGDSSFDATTSGLQLSRTWAQLQALSGTPINDNGSFSPRVSVCYASGDVALSAPGQLEVLNSAPTTSVASTGAVSEGQDATLLFSAPSDASDADRAAGFTYSVVLDTLFGHYEDRVTSTASAVELLIPAAYIRDNGSYLARARITDQDGGYSEQAVSVVVQEVAPTLIVQGEGNAVEGADYRLELSASDPGADSVSRWLVDWDDGSGSVESFDGAKQSLSHRFADDGLHSIRITAFDEDGSTQASKQVSVLNAAPTLSDLAVSSSSEGAITVLSGSITDPGLLDSFSLGIDWGDGTSESVALAAGTSRFALNHRYLDDDPSGTPADIRSIAVTLRDDDGDSSAASVGTTVSNSAPEFSGLGTLASRVDESSLVTLVGEIVDAGILDTHVLSIDWGDGSANDEVAVDPQTRAFLATHRYADDNPTATGEDVYTISAQVSDDDGGNASASTTVTIVNRAPSISGLQLSEVLGSDSSQATLTGSFSDIGTCDTHVVLIDWGDGSPEESAVLDAGGLSFSAGHVFSFLDAPGYQLSVRIIDDDLGVAAASVNTAAYPVNRAPTAVDDEVSGDENTPIALDLLANDSDLDGDLLSAFVLTQLEHGTLLSLGSGRFSYLGNPDFTGDDSFSYVARDARVGSNVAQVRLVVAPRNSAPTAANDRIESTEDTAVTFDVRDNDGDPESDALSVQVVDLPQHGSLLAKADGSFSYTPVRDFNGTDTFSYRVSDGNLLSKLAVVSVVLAPVNDPPRLAEIADATLFERQTFRVSAAGSDVDLGDVGDTLRYALDVAPTGASIDADSGAIVWQALDGDANGSTHDFTVRVSDASGESATQSFKVKVLNVAPTLTATGLEASYIGEDFVLDLTSSDPGVDTISEWRIDWGDGQIVDYSGSPGRISHVYSSVLGKVLIRATASDEDGSYLLDPLQVVVLPLPLPADATLDFSGSLPGELRVHLSSLTAIAAGTVTLLDLVASVPTTAPYGAAQILDIDAVSVNGQALNGADDDALQVVGYLGDGDANGRVDRRDVMLIQRNAANADSGFAAWSVVDPRFLADVDLDGRITGRDIVRIGQEMNRYDSALIPNLPTTVPLTVTPAQAWPAPASSGQTLPQIDFGDSFASFAVGSDDPRNKRENWRRAFVTNMASNSINPNSRLQVTLAASLQSTASL